MIKTFRRITQILTIFLIIAIPVLNKNEITAITGSLYSLAVGPIWITEPLSGFQAIIASVSSDATLLVSMFIPIIFAFVFGRVFCGWFCPQNTISELFDYLSSTGLRLFNFKGSPSATPRYAIMIVLLMLTPVLGFPVANLISAPGIISIQITKYLYEGIVGLEAGLIGLIILSEVFLVRRLWCNYICPVGGFLGLFRFRRTMKVACRADSEHPCGKCLECVKACGLGLDPMGGKIYPLCHNCGDCIAACEKIAPAQRPLSFRF